jgi:hypothetical protein
VNPSKSNPIVDTNLPYAGLGNMLLVWARAVVFASLNELPMAAPVWQSFHIGPWLRKERCKRYYGNFFSSKGYTSRLRLSFDKIATNPLIHHDPEIVKIDLTQGKFSDINRQIFLFSKMPPWNDYFQDLKNHQSVVKNKLYEDIHLNLLTEILRKPAPQIGIHIRRGDYAQPDLDNDFAIKRCVSTPLEWYVKTLEQIRQHVGFSVPATVFSDGYPEELGEILSLPNVAMSPETSAISDLITMSRSKVLIGSSHSSFSAWASYLGQCPTIWHSARHHLYEPIFTPEVRNLVYEGSLNPFTDEPTSTVLLDNLKQAFSIA